MARKNKARAPEQTAAPSSDGETVTLVVHGAEIHGPFGRLLVSGSQDVPMAYLQRCVAAGYGKALDMFMRQGRLSIGALPSAPVAPEVKAVPPASADEQCAWVAHETDTAFLDRLARDVLTHVRVANAAFERLKELDNKA